MWIVSCADPLLVFRDITVGWPGSALCTWADASMASLVVDSFKSRVALNNPDILPLLPSATTACPVMDCRILTARTKLSLYLCGSP